MKRQVISYEKICIKHLPGKGFVSKIYKELSKINNKINNPIKRNGQKINHTLIKRRIQEADKHMKRCNIISH